MLGGFLTEHLHWSLIFWINLPLGLAALGMTSAVLKRVPFTPRKHQLDYLGALLMIVGGGRAPVRAVTGAACVSHGSRRRSADSLRSP